MLASTKVYYNSLSSFAALVSTYLKEGIHILLLFTL